MLDKVEYLGTTISAAGISPTADTGRKNEFASNLLSANIMQICANWGINLSKGGKCRFCIPFTRGCK